MIKNGLLYSLLLLFIIAGGSCAGERKDVAAISGASLLAVYRTVPSTVSLKVNGMIKDELELLGTALNGLAKTRIRTREVTPSGEYLGAYAYDGIPVFNLLEGIAPKKPADALFDRPLDMIVTFISASGQKRHFSYGELTMADDSLPVILAYHREQVLPSKDPEKYGLNQYRSNISGLRLICPREPDTSRYLDNVIAMTFDLPETAHRSLPSIKKGYTCKSESILCISGKQSQQARFETVKKQKVSQWVRVGHGRGYKGISRAAGYNLRSFLLKNFPHLHVDNFFLFIACDGYRSILSGREIFHTENGNSYLLLDSMNGREPRGGFMLAPVNDFFVDRDVWGLSHIIMLSLDQ